MDNIIKQWNLAALKYTSEQENSEYVRINKNIVQNRFRSFNGEKILDLGCGYGFYTDYFGSKGANAIGIDGSEKMIEIARQQYPLSEFCLMDITKPLEFEKDSFDIVFSNQVLMDVENIDFVLSECKRVLKNKGLLYFSIVHPAFYDGKWIKDENGYCRAKALEKYISLYSFTNSHWGETEHFHRPLSYYLNTAAKNGFMLKEANEPVSYDGKIKNRDIPLFFFAEYIKTE